MPSNHSQPNAMQPSSEPELEQRLSQEVPELVSTNIPTAQLMALRWRREQQWVRRGGLVCASLVTLSTSWLVIQSQSQPVLRPATLQEVAHQPSVEPESYWASHARQSHPPPASGWQLELGDVTDNGAVTLVLTSTSPQTSESMVVGYVTPPQAFDVPVWQLPPADQETMHQAREVAQGVVPTEL